MESVELASVISPTQTISDFVKTTPHILDSVTFSTKISVAMFTHMIRGHIQAASVQTVIATQNICHQQSFHDQMTRQPSRGTFQTMVLRLLVALLLPCRFLTTLTIHSTILTSSAATNAGIQEIPLTHPTTHFAARKAILAKEESAQE